MSSQDGDDPAGKPPRSAPSTMAGVPAPRHGLPPPRPQSAPHVPPPHQPQQPLAPYPPQAPTEQPPAPSQPPPPYAQPPPPYAQPPQPYVQPPPPYAQPAQPYAQPPQPYVQQQFTPPPASPPMLGDPPVFTQAAHGVPHAQVVNETRAGTESNPIQQFAEVIEKVPGRFVAFLKISTKRAFRLRIEPTEVLPDERGALLSANPPIVEENLQAFLAWRRSVLFLVATLLVPLAVIGMIDALSGTKVAPAVRYVKLLPAVAETMFCLICWWQLKHWHHWRQQRRWLFIGWLLFIGTPFLVFAYPLKDAFIGMGRGMSAAQIQELGWTGMYNKAVAPFAYAMIAMFQLAPKVISLMPGLIRSSLVIKLLFPGAAAPGWLIVMAAPLYALIAYALLIIPYQFTGEPWFIVGIFFIVGAQALVARSGFHLARPLSQDEAMAHIDLVRKFYLALLIVAAACVIGGLGVLTKLLNMEWTTIVSTLLKFETNVLTLTIIGADLVVTNLDRARGYTEGREHVEEQTEEKIAAFVGLNARPGPPP